MNLIAYRDLIGVAYTEDEVKEIAAEIEVERSETLQVTENVCMTRSSAYGLCCVLDQARKWLQAQLDSFFLVPILFVATSDFVFMCVS
jgi:energy-converting hydrogenase A subunit M